MRNLSTLIACLLFTSVSVFSQDAPEAAKTPSSLSKFRFGLFITPNIGWEKTNNTDIATNGSKIGFGFGLMTDINFSPRYALATGITINRINHSSIQTLNGISFTTDVSSQYVEVPITLKLKTNEIGYFTYFGKFGFNPSFNTKSKYSTSLGTTGNFSSQTQPIRLALVVGLGTEYNISGDTRILMGIDFNNGFTNVYTKNATRDNNGNKRSSISNFIALNLGIFF